MPAGAVAASPTVAGGSIRTAASSAPVASAAGKLLPKKKTAQIFFIFAISTD